MYNIYFQIIHLLLIVYPTVRDRLCGGCHTYLPQPPCHKLEWYKKKVKRHCGWWRRRHTCYK